VKMLLVDQGLRVPLYLYPRLFWFWHMALCTLHRQAGRQANVQPSCVLPLSSSPHCIF
jgi:hypothetical protein